MTIDEYRDAVRAFYCSACWVTPGEHCMEDGGTALGWHEIDLVHDVRAFAHFQRDGDAPPPDPPVIVSRLPEPTPQDQ